MASWVSLSSKSICASILSPLATVRAAQLEVGPGDGAAGQQRIDMGSCAAEHTAAVIGPDLERLLWPDLVLEVAF